MRPTPPRPRVADRPDSDLVEDLCLALRDLGVRNACLPDWDVALEAIAKVKEVIHDGASKPLDEANLLEQQGFASLFTSEDQTEGMTAFMEKRAADFKGK